MGSRRLFLAALGVAATGCARRGPRSPTWLPQSEAREAEYRPYMAPGTATLTGQAFLTRRDGGVVKAAGRKVTLDPATSVGAEWWDKVGRLWLQAHLVPPSEAFWKARRTVVADADGRFKFADLPAGRYYVRSEVTWEVGGYYPTQGGLVGKLIEVRPGAIEDVILNELAN